ncbi:hypothetical protein WA026_005188, partial [Henosepilachna vigintioctopunctata]
MFKQLIGKVSDLEIAISFNGNMMEGIKKDLEEIKKENKNLKREHEKLKIEVQSLKNEMAILKNQAVANAVTADFQTRRNNVIMIGLSKTAEVVKVLNKLDINIKDEEIKTRQISFLLPVELWELFCYGQTFVEFSDDEFCYKNQPKTYLKKITNYCNLLEGITKINDRK